MTINERARRVGKVMAGSYFTSKSNGRIQRNSEVRMRESELAEICAMAFQHGEQSAAEKGRSK